MNSEELEQSLRTEFESYLKTVLAEMRQEASEFQVKLQSQFDEAFQGFSARLESEHQFDDAFRGSVAEHLRLARDEGARITADAMVEAEKLDQSTAVVETKYDTLRDAVNDISSKDSQSAILKSLVYHAGEFAPRGAFFIIKNEHFVGWKVFGDDAGEGESAIRDIHFPTSSDSILGAAASSLSTVEGSRSGDAAFTEPLNFGQPDLMYAVPLVARGRAVAVLYADQGDKGTNVNLEALETLVRVAGLTVELLASTQTAKAENRTVGAADFEDATHDDDISAVSYEPETSVRETAPETPQVYAESESSGFAFSEKLSFDSGFPQESEPSSPFEAQQPAADTFGSIDTHEPEPQVEETAFGDYTTESFETDETPFDGASKTDDTSGAIVFDSGGSIEPAAFETSPFDKAAEEFQPAAAVTGGGFNPIVEPVVEAPAPAPHARLSDRPVDLPIEVPDDERRIHNDARRFARLLVSEIKLYNEKKVIEGREASDLYERLREAIDRSREMYDKRVQPPVAAKFDYFHYEIVNSLADGDMQRLGPAYPGSSV